MTTTFEELSNFTNGLKLMSSQISALVDSFERAVNTLQVTQAKIAILGDIKPGFKISQEEFMVQVNEACQRHHFTHISVRGFSILGIIGSSDGGPSLVLVYQGGSKLLLSENLRLEIPMVEFEKVGKFIYDKMNELRDSLVPLQEECNVQGNVIKNIFKNKLVALSELSCNLL